MFKFSLRSSPQNDALPVAQSGPTSDATAELRAIMPDLYFINTPASHMARHLAVLHRVDYEQPVIEFYRLPHSQLTEMVFCASDDANPGLLAKICGTLIAERVDIQTAFIFTIDSTRIAASVAQAGGSPRRIADKSEASGSTGSVAFDTLYVTERFRGHTRSLAPDTIRRLRAQLIHALGVPGSPNLSSGGASRKAPQPVAVDEITAVNTSTGDRTMITLRASNRPGVLYQAASSLATLGLNICVAQINSDAQSTNDVFFVTNRSGSALTEEELFRLPQRLQSMLQSCVPYAAPLTP